MITSNNTKVYVEVLKECLATVVADDTTSDNDIVGELLFKQIKFIPHEHIQGANEKYIDHEIKWYMSKDLSIKNHAGIENNKIWKACATEDGHVNSNYGWCLWSKENYEQFDTAIDAIVKDKNTKHAVMIYSRPSINVEWNDKIHANSDMICTIYTTALLRDNLLHLGVHMRSNDIWYGLRNDLAWQQFVQELFVARLNNAGVQCVCGPIVWHADSLHIYKRNVDDITNFIKSI